MIPAGAALLPRSNARRRLGERTLRRAERDAERVLYFSHMGEIWAEIHWFCPYRDGMALRACVWREGAWRAA